MNAKRARKPQRVARAGAKATKNATRAGVTDLHGTVAPVSYFPNDDLVKVILEAWTSQSFKERLLTFPEKDRYADWKDWLKADANAYTAMTAKTSQALAGVVSELRLGLPVVLTQEQYENGYRKNDDKEVVFVLPDAPQTHGKQSLTTARVMMAATIRGM